MLFCWVRSTSVDTVYQARHACRYINQLKMQHPQHPFVQKWETSEAQITTLATDMKASAGITA